MESVGFDIAGVPKNFEETLRQRSCRLGEVLGCHGGGLQRFVDDKKSQNGLRTIPKTANSIHK